MFSITSEPIQLAVEDFPGAGGFVNFEGKVRNHADGKPVLRLEYQAQVELATSEGNTLAQEAIETFGLLFVSIIHRIGILEIGETAVSIQVAAAHRREAFAGCEWIIDQLKHRVPIWKKEHYADGASDWVYAGKSQVDALEISPLFTRQQLLPEVGLEGQRKLQNSRVLLVGVGGLGSGCLPYLVGAGVGTIGICDPDTVSISNLHRQVLFATNEVGRLKADRAAAYAKRLNPSVTVEVHPFCLDSTNADKLVDSYDWIVEGTDSLETKFLLNDICQQHKKPLILASVHRFEGQVLTVIPGDPCFRCMFPIQPSTSCVGTCEEIGVLGVVPGVFGMLQATECLKGILEFGKLHSESVLLMDLRSGKTSTIAREINPTCPNCGETTTVSTPLELEIDSLEEARIRWQNFELIDVREEFELPRLTIPHRVLPCSRFDPNAITSPAVLLCHSGIRTYHLCHALREMGFENVISLKGGIVKLQREGTPF